MLCAADALPIISSLSGSSWGLNAMLDWTCLLKILLRFILLRSSSKFGVLCSSLEKLTTLEELLTNSMTTSSSFKLSLEYEKPDSSRPSGVGNSRPLLNGFTAVLLTSALLISRDTVNSLIPTLSVSYGSYVYRRLPPL